MANLRFYQNSSVMLDPFQLSGVPVEFTVENLDTSTAENLGFFLKAATTVGDVDNPAEEPPESDYNDVLQWGADTFLGLEPSGGLKVTVGADTTYFRFGKGDLKKNKIAFGDLVSGGSGDFTLELEAPPGVPSRRLYVSLFLE